MTKKILKGVVTSAKNNKTIVVEVTRKFKHPFYEKIIKRTKKYHAHDESNKFKEGEKVSIIECKPFSKKKEDKKLTKDQAEKKIQLLKKDLFNIRFKKINNQIENPAQYNEIKKNIARLYTTIKNTK